MHTAAERDKSDWLEFTKNMSQWAFHNGCYQVFEDSRREVEPYQKGYSGASEIIGKLGHLKPFVSLSVSWVVMQGAAVAESSGAPTGEVAKGCS